MLRTLGRFRPVGSALPPVQVRQSGHELVVEQEQHHGPQARLGQRRQHREVLDDGRVVGGERELRRQEVFGRHQDLKPKDRITPLERHHNHFYLSLLFNGYKISDVP